LCFIGGYCKAAKAMVSVLELVVLYPPEGLTRKTTNAFEHLIRLTAISDTARSILGDDETRKFRLTDYGLDVQFAIEI
jgi:predicted RNA binding protein with dsRBD fold (UPF0201 family)